MRKILSMLLVLSSLSFAQLIGPKLAVPQPNYDFGDLKQGEVVSHEFIITNNGDDKLIIKDVRPSCGCTAAKPEKDSLKPGESVKIKVEFNTAGREGKQHKYVYVTTNDKEQPEFRIKFFANILVENKSEQSSNGTTHN
jgi:hypothetical protein